MTPGRILLVSAMAVIVILIALNVYYRSVQAPVWKEERAAEAQALKVTDLKEATDSEKFVWEEPVWIVKGKDKDGEDAYVWLKKDNPILLKAKDGLSKADMKQKFLESKPDADIHDINVGMLGGVPVYQIYYDRKQASITSYYYEFYKFQDGAFIITYKLPSQ
ncbi:DUF5590 domain-containing protein [Paenibacillus solisilvae]|uniref:DUF5590 domain-containing protein n=1 Tax=Paenibacillus solisilvae TaxID=2486751 RepID=A0ABW0W163_9BACL